MESLNFRQEEINIKDPEEAMDFIREMIEHGEKPCVSVPDKYWQFLEKGLKPHSSWIPGLDGIVGTLGRRPYLPEIQGEGRKIVRINKIEVGHIRPRFTGPDHAFHGVVFLDGPINPDSLEVETVH